MHLVIDRPPPNEGRQARTVNHRLSVLASYFAFRIRQDDDRGDGAWRQRSNPVSTPDDEIVSHRLTGRDQPVRERRREFRRRVPRRLPARLDPLLIERLITTAVSWRDKAILTLLCRTGQRIGDWSDTNGRHGLLGMALSDVDEQHQTITVRLKGARQDHRVPVTDDFWPLFRQYLQTERPTPARTAAAWVAQRRGHGVPLSYAAFESALRLLGRKGRRDRARASVSSHRRARRARDQRQSEGHAGTPRPRAPVDDRRPVSHRRSSRARGRRRRREGSHRCGAGPAAIGPPRRRA